MIAFLQPHPIGNAIRCLLAPAAGATMTRVLRKTVDSFVDESDPDAAVVFEGDDRHFIDVTTLVNGTPYYYKAFDLVGAAWVGSDSATATPAATASLHSVDPLDFVRKRLEAGLRAEVVAGRLKHETGAIPCFTAPPKFEDVKFPMVTVHVASDAAAHRGLGEIVASDEFDAVDDTWIESEGWLSRVQLNIVGWAVVNSDVRNALRKAIKKVIIGNLPIFASVGISEIDFSQSDTDDMESYSSPVFQSIGSFNCIVASIVDGRAPVVHDVEVLAEAA